ncbi:MAG: NADH-quinone oxidoreductase subunit NuoG [Solirubrobacteraceae bacterium]
MPRPQPKTVTFSIDGREVQAPENTMLVDAAKLGDVEIPVFCYEPKLGAPVGACRMCLVEIEGIPKLQTGCSTPVKDGMVVHTQTERVQHAQEAVVEFLLINHPLDCPVCDKGGECPLQDISFGWGGGRSRYVEPKRHFEKPLALSPLIAIDRERCILCYRCVRFSQEISEDYQLVLQERGAHTYVSTFDGHPYVAPFSGNIIELCPVGALTSQPYRFRARPWDIEGAGSVCTLCPAQCNVTFTVRDDRVLRVLGRDNAEVDDGWLCDKGRFAYQSVHVDERITQPLIRDGGELRPVPWERALTEAAAALGRAKGNVGAIAGGETTNEEGHLLARLMREGLGSHDLDSRADGTLPLELHHALGAPAAQATIADVEFAHAVVLIDCEPVDDMPILDLRFRKGVRRRGVKLSVATSRPSSLDPNARRTVRFAPGAGEAFARALTAALTPGAHGDADRHARAAGIEPDALLALAEGLRDAGEDVVIVFGERLVSGPRGAEAARALLDLAGRLDVLGGRDGAGLLCVPSSTNGRGLAEAGVLPNAGPGLSAVENLSRPARDAAGIAAAAAAGELSALYLLHADPLCDLPGRAAWSAALERASTVIAHAQFLTEGIREHATVVFPAESYAEKEGTLTHPDGRIQRLRAAIGHPGDVRAEWSVLADLARRCGLDLGVLTPSMASAQLFDAVPFYAGLTLEEIGGKGVRWPVREAASAWPAPAEAPERGAEAEVPAAAQANGRLRLGTFRSVWNSEAVRVSPALRFLHPKPTLEMSPADAQRLKLFQGDRVVVGSDGATVDATVTLRDATPEGTVFMETNALDGWAGLVQVRKA